MQLVLVNNRIVAHGENFLAMGDVVINTETGARYEKATVAECSGCPSDIDQVGYEYRAGVFVPCAPYGKGKGTGYFMEVCPDCATPRSSGLLITDINWGKIASVSCSITNTSIANTKQQSLSFSVNNSELEKYSSLRYRIKAGSILNISRIAGQSAFTFVQLGAFSLYNITNITDIIDGVLEFKEDVVIPFYLFNTSVCNFVVSSTNPLSGEHVTSNKWVTAEGQAVGPLSITVAVPGGYLSGSTYVYSSANLVIDLEGRK